MVKEELCEKVVEVRRASDSDGRCIGFGRGCAEAELQACSSKWKMFGRKTVFL